MKTVHTMRLLIAGICGSLLLNAGCGTLSPEKKALLVSETSDGLNQLIDKSRNNSVNLQESVSSLARAVPEEIDALYEMFETNAGQMRSIFEEVKTLSRQMNEDTVDFFRQWEERLALSSDKILKESGQSRSAYLMDHYSSIAESMEKVEEIYLRYERDVADIETVLGNDLTPKGLESANAALLKVTRNAGPMDEATQRVLDGLDELITLLRQ